MSREHLAQLEEIQEVLPSPRDEAHFHRGVSRLITPNLYNLQRVLHILAATQEVPQHNRLLSSYEAETGLTGCGRDSRASSRVETGTSGNFLSCSNGVKDPLEVPEVRCD